MASLSPAQQDKLDHCHSILQSLLQQHTKVVFANSLGAEDMVLTDIILQQYPQITMFSLDTGRLPQATYALMQQVQQHYKFIIPLYYPDATAIEAYTRENGINGFYNSVELRKACCGIRKVEPLKRALAGHDAWITGQRRNQSITRSDIQAIEFDQQFGLTKCNPLLDWEEPDVWAYIKTHQVPYNALHDQHYPSIGCEPCTRAIAVGEDIRAGRWWWENPENKECGLHPGSSVSPLPKPSNT